MWIFRFCFLHVVTFALSVAAKTEVNLGKPVLSKMPDAKFCPTLLVSGTHCQGRVFVQKSELLICWEKKAEVMCAWYLISLPSLWHLHLDFPVGNTSSAPSPSRAHWTSALITPGPKWLSSLNLSLEGRTHLDLYQRPTWTLYLTVCDPCSILSLPRPAIKFCLHSDGLAPSSLVSALDLAKAIFRLHP